MQIWELFIIAVGLAMDAFAVSICKGLGVQALRPQHALWTGLWFGGFQALMPAVATSIDALAVGVTFAFLQVDVVPAVSLIGLVTFALACAGVKLGHMFGVRYKARAERFGGIVLVLMGGKILLEHLGILP